MFPKIKARNGIVWKKMKYYGTKNGTIALEHFLVFFPHPRPFAPPQRGVTAAQTEEDQGWLQQAAAQPHHPQCGGQQQSCQIGDWST